MNGIAATADANGALTIAREKGATLNVSAVGYKPRRVKITADTPDTINVKLITDTRKLDEVVISAKRRHKYSRKNNPAVELMKRVIAAKERSNLENHDYYQYNKYQKVTMGINNLTPEDLENKKFKDSPWLLNQVEVCPFNNKLILPFSIDETVKEHIYRTTAR